MKYLCKKCDNYHQVRSIFYHLKDKRRLSEEEVNKIGINGFGKIYSLARYCPTTKEYTILKGFI